MNDTRLKALLIAASIATFMGSVIVTAYFTSSRYTTEDRVIEIVGVVAPWLQEREKYIAEISDLKAEVNARRVAGQALEARQIEIEARVIALEDRRDESP